jgi:hypothetical protein
MCKSIIAQKQPGELVRIAVAVIANSPATDTIALLLIFI